MALNSRLLRADCGSVVPCDMPIIGVTANVMPDQVQTYLEAGMDAVVAKPVNKQRLLETLIICRRAKEWLSPSAKVSANCDNEQSVGKSSRTV